MTPRHRETFALEKAARIHAELVIGIGGRRSQACIVLGFAVVVLAPEKYNSIAYSVLEWRVK